MTKNGSPPDWRLDPDDDPEIIDVADYCYMCGATDVQQIGLDLICIHCGQPRPREEEV